MARLLELRQIILGLIEAGRTAGVFDMEPEFQVSTRWFPAESYQNIAKTAGEIFVLGRPPLSERTARDSKVISEEITFQFCVLFAESEEDETANARIEQHIEFVEALQDWLRELTTANGYVWIRTAPATDSAGLPYNYMELTRGAFCSIFEMTFHLTRKG